MRITNSHEYISQLAKDNQPALAYHGGQNLKEWQQEARAKLVELLKLPRVKCEDDFKILKQTKKEGYTQIDLEFQSEPRYYIPASLLVPDGLLKPLPTVICLQGHSRGAHISLGIVKFPGDEKSIAGGRDFAVRAVKEGFCAIVMDQRYMGATGQTETGGPACIHENAAMATLLMGRTPIGERVWDVQRLIDIMETYLTQYVNIKRIICMGNSGGGTTTFYASCVEERVYMSIPSCAVCTYEDSIMAMYHCPCNFIPDIRKYFNMGDLGVLIAPRRLVVVCGIEDNIFPIHGVEASFEIIEKAYKDAGKSELCHLIKGNGGHLFYPDETWPIAKKML